MVSQLPNAGGEPRCWVLAPTRSMGWREVKRLVLVTSAVCLAVGLVFLARGLPLILPFCLLQAGAIALAFYLVARAGERREVVRLDGDRLVVERGGRSLENAVVFNRFWVRVELLASRYRLHPARLILASHGRVVELGRFLTDVEKDHFARSLRAALTLAREEP